MSGAAVYGHPRTTYCTGYPDADAGTAFKTSAVCDSTAHHLPHTDPFPMRGAAVCGHPRTTYCTGYPEADA